MTAESQFIWDSYHDRYYEVIGETDHSGKASYACACGTEAAEFVVIESWPLVGLAHATAGRLRGADIYLSNPGSIAHAKTHFKLKEPQT